MSHIHEALKNVEKSRSKSVLGNSDNLGIMDQQDQRTEACQEMHGELTVYGYSADNAPFYEEAKAVRGNGQGGLFLMAAPVAEGQELLVINNRTAQEQLCRVVNYMIRDAQTGEVSVAFTAPHPGFW